MFQETTHGEKKARAQEAENKVRKKQMQQRFIAQMNQNKLHNQAFHRVQPVTSEIKNETKKEKEKRRKAEKSLRRTQEKNKQLQQRYRLLEQDYRQSKHERHEEGLAYAQVKKQLETLTRESEQLLRQNEQLREQLHAVSTEQIQQQKDQFEREKLQWGKQLKKATADNKRQHQLIQSLQQKNKLLKGIQVAEKPPNNQEKVQQMRQELHFYKQKLANVEYTLSPHSMIETLCKNLSIYTVDQYVLEGKNPFGPLGAQVASLLKKQKLLEIKEKETPKAEAVWLFGYIGKTQEGWVFFDLSYQSYTIVTNENQMDLQEGKPARAVILNPQQVHISHAFEVEPTEMRKTRQKRKQHLRKFAEEKEDYPYLGTHDLLIIGSRNQDSYTERLKKHGLTVHWHNPFEAGYKRLNGKYQKADVVLVCTRHIPHSVLDHIDKKAEKVHLLDRDNEEILVARVFYALHHLKQTDG